MNPNGTYYSVGDVVLAYKEGLLTKAEATLAIRDLIPALGKIAAARQTLADAGENDG